MPTMRDTEPNERCELGDEAKKLGLTKEKMTDAERRVIIRPT